MQNCLQYTYFIKGFLISFYKTSSLFQFSIWIVYKNNAHITSPSNQAPVYLKKWIHQKFFKRYRTAHLSMNKVNLQNHMRNRFVSLKKLRKQIFIQYWRIFLTFIIRHAQLCAKTTSASYAISSSSILL